MLPALTPIPENETVYGLLVLWLLGGCGSAVASRLHSRWLHSIGLSFFGTYFLCLSVISVFGLLAFGSPFVAMQSAWAVAAALGMSLLSSVGLFWGTLKIARRNRARQASPVKTVTPGGIQSGSLVVRRVSRGGRRTPRDNEKIGAAPSRALVPPLSMLVMVGVLEEIVFRGLLVGVAVQQDRVAASLLIALSIVLFCFAHVHYGLSEALAKLPLAVVCAGLTLATQSVVAAVFTHAIFNALVWRVNKEAHERMPVLVRGEVWG